MDILGYSKNTHKNPKFGKVRQVPTREFLAKLPDWDLSHLPNLGFLWVFFKYPKISKNGNRLFFPVPGANPKLLTCTQFPNYNYTEDFSGKASRLVHLSRTGKIEEVCKCMFSILCMHCSLLIMPELHSKTRELSM